MDTHEQFQRIIELLEPISLFFREHPLRSKREEEDLPSRRLTKKEQDEAFRRQIVAHMELRSHARVLQAQFHLLQSPHNNRVRRYLQSHDPRVFEGLRRKST